MKPMTDNLSNLTTVAIAQRLRSDARYMAYALAAYQQQEGMDETELASALGTFHEMLTRLALCRRPSANAAQFAEQVRLMADYTLIDEALLAALLRQVEVVERLAQRPVHMQESTTATATDLPEWGLLAAARDREEAENEASESPDSTEE